MPTAIGVHKAGDAFFIFNHINRFYNEPNRILIVVGSIENGSDMTYPPIILHAESIVRAVFIA